MTCPRYLKVQYNCQFRDIYLFLAKITICYFSLRNYYFLSTFFSYQISDKIFLEFVYFQEIDFKRANTFTNYVTIFF